MEKLRATSIGITEESVRIDARTRAAGNAMGDLGRISGEVTSNIGEIAIGIQLISSSVRNIAVHTEQIGVIGDTLDASIENFRIRNEPAGQKNIMV